MLEKSNAALIEAIHAHTPQHSNPASLLMDMLNIGREAAYRRLRGEVPFTFGEASALCARMHFSLDRVVGLAATDKLSFQLKFKEFTALLETYNEILERDIAFMREVASDPTTEFATATNSLPAEFYGKYDNLNRFKLFKWLYQHEVGNPAVRTFEELKLPAELQRNCREYVRWVQSVATTYLIFDDSNFKHWLNALRAYREMHLISQESVRVLRDELFAMLDEMETVAVKGEFENGNRIFLYLSDIDLESSYSYVTTSRHQAVNIGMFPDVDLEKFTYIGNSSLTGAYAMVMSDAAIETCQKVASNMTYLELSTHPGYMDAFVAACFLPHTNAKLFPHSFQE